jgi:hypothetical protein
MTRPRRTNGRAMKARGDAFEREVAAHINERCGLSSFRAPLSGGGAFHRAGPWAAGGSDLLGTPGLHIEAKRVERLDFPGALRQAQTALTKTGSPDIPVVVNRRNRQATGDSYALLRLDDLLTLYRAYLVSIGEVSHESTSPDPPQS